MELNRTRAEMWRWSLQEDMQVSLKFPREFGNLTLPFLVIINRLLWQVNTWQS